MPKTQPTKSLNLHAHRPPGVARIDKGVQGGEDLQVVAAASLRFGAVVHPVGKCGRNVLVELARVGEAGVDLCRAQPRLPVCRNKQGFHTAEGPGVAQDHCAAFALGTEFGAVRAGVGSRDNHKARAVIEGNFSSGRGFASPGRCRWTVGVAVYFYHTTVHHRNQRIDLMDRHLPELRVLRVGILSGASFVSQ